MDARGHLERLARHGRAAGSLAEQDAREYCAATLGQMGFSVAEEPFEYSALPGELATPMAGVVAMAVFLAAGHVGFRGHAWVALVVLLCGGAGIAAGAWWLASRGVLACPWWRARSVNLVATRGEPRVWIVAHLDSKSQPIPIAARALGVTGCIVAWLVAVAVSVAQGAGAPLAWVWLVLAAAGVLCAIPVTASVVRDNSPGAVDNASGVAAVLVVAGALQRDTPLGVFISSAEELGLAGARAWVRGRPPGVAVNFDGIDDAGVIRVTYRGRPPERLLAVFARAATASSVALRNGRLPAGVLLDGVALADAGWEVATVSRGRWATVARIHTPRDDLSRLSGSGIADVARLVTNALVEMS